MGFLFVGSLGGGQSLHAQTTPEASQAEVHGAANINITPRRVVFDGSKRTEAVYVFNQGTAPATVDVRLVDNVMLATGEIAPVADLATKVGGANADLSRLHSAKEMILATPSRLTLEPGKGKTIRIRASLPDEQGPVEEWRTHLTVTTIRSRDAGLTVQAAASTAKAELAFRIDAVFGVSIPLIVRSGAPSAAVAIEAIKLTHGDVPGADGAPARRVPILDFTLVRQGRNSIFGNVEARIDSNRSREVIGFIRGIAVYPELDRRRVSMILAREPRNGEAVTVTFFSDDAQMPSVQATGRIALP